MYLHILKPLLPEIIEAGRVDMDVDDSGSQKPTTRQSNLDTATVEPDYTFEDGRTWKGQLDNNGKPIGMGVMTGTDGTTQRYNNVDGEGRELDGMRVGESLQHSSGITQAICIFARLTIFIPLAS